MNSRERLRRCYYHEQLDRPGVYVRDSYPGDDPSYDRLKALINSRAELKHRWRPCWITDDTASLHNVEPQSDDYERHVTVLHTPRGDLKSMYLRSLKGQPGRQVECLLKTREDAQKYLSLPVETPKCDVSGFFEADRAIGTRGIAEAQMGLNPAGFVATLFGSEKFAIISATDRDIIHQLCQRQLDIIKARLEFLISSKVGPYFSMFGEEFLVPPLHGPTDFCDFNVKYDKPIIDLVHQVGGRFHIHSHGSIKRVFQGFIDMGADVLHPFEAPPMGDITAVEAKQLARGKICLEGNIQIAALYEATPDQVRQETRALIKDAFDDNQGLIICPTASPYLYGQGNVCFEQFRAMIETVLAWPD